MILEEWRKIERVGWEHRYSVVEAEDTAVVAPNTSNRKTERAAVTKGFDETHKIG